MEINNKNTVFLLCSLLFLIVFFGSYRIYLIINDSSLSYLSKHKITQRDSKTIDTVKNRPKEAEPDKEIIPANFELDVPFISQAPYGAWDALHEDACEEASFLMLHAWYNNEDSITLGEAEGFIQEMVAHEENTGYQKSITLGELAEIAKNKYRLSNVEVKDVSSWIEIKQALYNNSSPVIAGMAGKKLNNPNFRNGGPNYHMLTIIGYDASGFITNDPGTRKGEKYYYENELLYNALHDYNSLDINLGDKKIMYLFEDS